jgi:hypothetical protein
MADHNIETRTETILRHVQQCMRETATSWPSFGQTVAEEYVERVPLHKRVITFHFDGDAYKDMRANGQLVDRCLDGSTRLPADLEESIVHALPKPYRDACVRDLARRYGLLGARRLDAENTSLADDLEAIGDLVESSGRAVAHLGRMVVDGVIDARDLPHIKPTQAAIDQAIANLTAMRHRLDTVTVDVAHKPRAVGE